MSAVFSIALPVFALILTGAFAGWRRLLGADVTGAINMFVVWLALPAVLFQAMAHIHLPDLLNFGLLASYGLAIVIPFILALTWSRGTGTGVGGATMRAMAATYSNVGYMGLPLCRIAFGDASLVPSVIMLVVTACPHFAMGVGLLEFDRPGRGGAWHAFRRVGGALIRNPLLISPALGLLVALSGAGLPVAVDRYLTLLGAAATPCALVASGLMLIETTERFQPRLVARLVCLKLLVQPAVAWILAFHVLTLPPVWGETAVIMSALPTGAGAFILAKLYNREVAATSGTVLVSTVLSFGTLSWLLSVLG